jgi:hypothetical protein
MVPCGAEALYGSQGSRGRFWIGRAETKENTEMSGSED